MSPRTRLLLEGPIIPTLLRLAWPNVLVMLVQASTGLIETWFVSRLGHRRARRDGAGVSRLHDDADALGRRGRWRHLVCDCTRARRGTAQRRGCARMARDHHQRCARAFLLRSRSRLRPVALSCARRRGRFAGGGAQLFERGVRGDVLVWLMNALASVLRGTGNMLVPSVGICAGVVLLVPLSPLPDLRPRPDSRDGHRGRRGCGRAHHRSYRGGHGLVHLVRPQRGAPQAVTPAQSPVRRHPARGRSRFRQHVADHAGLCAHHRAGRRGGGPDAVAGYGTGARLEYLLIPLVFGLGAPLVALVGTNIGAGQQARALRIALIGGALAFVLTESIGLTAAIWPHAWLGLFGNHPPMLETGSAYLRIVGPTYGFFGLGLALYFASQGAGKLLWPLLAGFVRLLIAIGGGWLALRATGSSSWLFAALTLGLVVYGVMLTAAIGSGVWFGRDQWTSPFRFWRSGNRTSAEMSRP